jgi:hypothetical protein
MVADEPRTDPEIGTFSSLRDIYERAAAIPDEPRQVHFICALADEAYYLGLKDGLRAARSKPGHR